MKLATYEAVVENGRIKLLDSVSLPENAKVYVVVAGVDEASSYRVAGPRLAQPERAADFIKEVAEEPLDAGLR